MKISKKSFRVIEGLFFSFSGFSKGHNSVKNVGRVMVLDISFMKISKRVSM